MKFHAIPISHEHLLEPDPWNRVNFHPIPKADEPTDRIGWHFTRSQFHMSTCWNPIPGIGWNVIRSLESEDFHPIPISHEYPFKNYGTRSPELWNRAKFYLIPKADEPTVTYILQHAVMYNEVQKYLKLFHFSLLKKAIKC